jgi:hypothetical protein
MISEGFLLSSTAACILSYSICVSPIQQRQKNGEWHHSLVNIRNLAKGIKIVPDRSAKKRRAMD